MSFTFVIVFYLVLAIVGFYCLWVRMLKNGAAQAIKTAVQAKRLPDGTLLTAPPHLARLFGNSVLAQIAFYDGVMDGRGEAHHLLMSTLHPQIQVILSCMMLQSGIGRQSWWLSDLALPVWNLLNLSWGSAVVFPVYMFISLWVQSTTDKFPIPPKVLVESANVYSAVVATMFGLVLPLLLVYPTAYQCPPERRHAAIAYHRLAMIVFSLCRPTLRLVFTTLVSDGVNLGNAHWLRMGLYWTLTLYGAFFHIRTLLLSIVRGRNAFLEVFSPWHKRTAPDKRTLSVAAHEFLQYDLLIIALAVVPHYNYCTGRGKWEALAGVVALGPGAIAVLAQSKI